MHVENPFCGEDVCKSTCVAFDQRQSNVRAVVSTDEGLPKTYLHEIVIQRLMVMTVQARQVQKVGALRRNRWDPMWSRPHLCGPARGWLRQPMQWS
jgi:hypothetical protein